MGSVRKDPQVRRQRGYQHRHEALDSGVSLLLEALEQFLLGALGPVHFVLQRPLLGLESLLLRGLPVLERAALLRDERRAIAVALLSAPLEAQQTQPPALPPPPLRSLRCAGFFATRI